MGHNLIATVRDPQGRTALMRSLLANNFNPKLFCWLASLNQDINGRDHDGYTALMHAIKTRRANEIYVLLNKKADPLLTRGGESAMDLVTQYFRGVPSRYWAFSEAGLLKKLEESTQAFLRIHNQPFLQLLQQQAVAPTQNIPPVMMLPSHPSTMSPWNHNSAPQ